MFQSSGASPSVFGSFSQFAIGNGWSSEIQLLNTGSAISQASLNVLTDGGDPFPVFLPEQTSHFSASLAQMLLPHSMFEIDSDALGSLTAQTGSVRLTADNGVDGFVRFRYAPRDQEALVPLETRKAGSYVFSFDNTNDIATGVAVSNLGSAANIPVIIRNDSGAEIGRTTVALAANGHSAFVLGDYFAATTGVSGTVEFDTPVGGQISVLGIRFPPGGRFTTIPVVASTDQSGGSMPHLAVGDGWTTTVELVNFGSTSAQAQVVFRGDDGTPLLLPLSFAGSSTTTSVVDQALAPHARLVIQSRAANDAALQIGSAQLTSDGSLGGFIRYRYEPRDQEAIVPLESRNARAYVVAFDNTNGLATGVAVANLSNSAANIPVIIRNSFGAQIGSDSVVLESNGHSAFVLSDRFAATANQMGTIEFDKTAGGSIGVLGMRFPASGAFSTIPVIAP